MPVRVGLDTPYQRVVSLDPRGVGRLPGATAFERRCMPSFPLLSGPERRGRQIATRVALIEIALALVGSVLPVIGQRLALVGDPLALIRDPVAIVRGPVPIVGGPLAFVGDPLAFVGCPCALSILACHHPLPFRETRTLSLRQLGFACSVHAMSRLLPIWLAEPADDASANRHERKCRRMIPPPRQSARRPPLT
jgi:hypothetical protein